MEYIQFLVKNNVTEEFNKAIDTAIDYYEENGSFQDINEDDVPIVLKWYEKNNRHIVIQATFKDTSPETVIIELSKNVNDRYVIDELEDILEFDIDDLKYLKYKLKTFLLSKNKVKSR